MSGIPVKISFRENFKESNLLYESYNMTPRAQITKITRIRIFSGEKQLPDVNVLIKKNLVQPLGGTVSGGQSFIFSSYM
jgi:hypothetical protein